MSAGWLQVDKSAEGGPRVKRKVRKELQSLKGLCHGSPVHFNLVNFANYSPSIAMSPEHYF